MAPPLVVPNGALVRLLWALGSEVAINVLGAVVVGGQSIDQALANALGTAIKGSYTTHLAPLQAPDAGIARVGVRDIRSPNLPEFIDAGAEVVGVGTGELLPPQDAINVTLRTALSGKSFRGRTYLGGFDELQNAGGGVIAPAALAGALAFMNAVQGNLGANGLNLAVITKPQDDIVITETTTFGDGTTRVRTISHQSAKSGNATPVVAVESLNNRWETQRRRGNGRGAGTIAGLRSRQRIDFAA